ncbi:hypothetical protein [Bartonella rattaustraliani]|nr:hypothetical protein [Bartonella rattaustraliani]
MLGGAMVGEMQFNGARDPVATGRAVAHALQRTRANALHGGTE